MRIIITEKQEKLLNEAMDIQNASLNLPSHILDAVKSGSMPLSNNPSLNGFEEKILGKRFLEVKNEFSDDISSYDNKIIANKLSKLIAKCLKREENVRPQLEKICINALTEAFGIPEDGVNISCKLVQEISSRTQFHIKPDTDENFQYEDIESIDIENMNVEKRKLIGALIVGGAMDIAEKMITKCLQDIFELDNELPSLYIRILKINDYLIFTQPFKIEDGSHKQGGFVNVKMGNDITPTKIEGQAVIFPILMIEMIRGCMELWASHGLPDDVNDARAVINKADALENDPWYMRFGPVLWKSIYKESNFNYLPSFFAKLCELPNEEFFSVIRECCANTKMGERKISDILNRAKYDDDYSSFEYDIKQKQSDKGIIEDEYFTEEDFRQYYDGN